MDAFSKKDDLPGYAVSLLPHLMSYLLLCRGLVCNDYQCLSISFFVALYKEKLLFYLEVLNTW